MLSILNKGFLLGAATLLFFHEEVFSQATDREPCKSSITANMLLSGDPGTSMSFTTPPYPDRERSRRALYAGLGVLGAGVAVEITGIILFKNAKDIYTDSSPQANAGAIMILTGVPMILAGGITAIIGAVNYNKRGYGERIRLGPAGTGIGIAIRL